MAVTSTSAETNAAAGHRGLQIPRKQKSLSVRIITLWDLSKVVKSDQKKEKRKKPYLHWCKNYTWSHEPAFPASQTPREPLTSANAKLSADSDSWSESAGIFMQHSQPKGSIADTEVSGCTTGRPNVQTVEKSISSLAPWCIDNNTKRNSRNIS
jgi:hypothetical protein